MIRFAVRWLTVLSLLAVSAAAPAREELVDPAPVAVPAGLSEQQVAEAIKMALVGRTWTVEKQQPGRIDAALYIRTHVARIGIDYDATRVAIEYVSSDNLDYKEKRGKRYIHDNYLGWIQFLVNDLKRHLGNAAHL
jgi:hypothetical protein